MSGGAIRRLLAVALFAAGVAVTASADGANDPCARAEVLNGERGTWRVLPGPQFPAGDQVITAHTIDRHRPAVHFATNGLVVMRSEDAACSWEESYRLPDAATPQMPVTAASGRIERLDAARGVVIAPVSAPGAALPAAVPRTEAATVVVRSADGGDSWGRAETPPVLPGEPGPVAFGDDEGVVWAASGGLVHRSVDGGASFTPVTPPGDATKIDTLVASAFYITGGDMLWAKAHDGPAFRSLNDGLTWTRYDQAQVGTHGPVLQPVEKGVESRIAFFEADRATGELIDLIYSQDQGQEFRRLGKAAVEGLEGSVTSFEGEQRRGDIVLTSTGGVYRFHPRVQKMVSIDEFALGPMRGAQAPHVYENRVRYRFHSDSEVFIYEETAKGAAALPIPGVFDHTETAPEPAELAPAGGEVPVPAGASRTVRYRLSLPPRSTRLDTFFMLDTSNSTQGYIDGLRVGITKIARGLATAGVEGRYGLGEYQDNGATRGVRYARRADIGGADTLRSAITKLRTDGGEEPGYTALDQALTGTGIPKPSRGTSVPPGQDAGWRPRAVRTIVLVADESFAFDPEGAGRDAVAAALREEEVRFVGVVVRDEDFDPTLPGADCAQVVATPDKSVDGTEGDHRLRCQLEDLARAAGTVAPASGTDCDGDGKVDVAAGSPLVCTIPPEGSEGIVAVAEPLRRLLLAVTDEQPVTLRAGGEGGGAVDIEPAADYRRLDLKKEHALDFSVRFTCARDEAGERFPVRLDALVAGREVAQAQPTVVCGTVAAAVAAEPAPKRKPAREPVERPGPAPAVAAPAPAPPVPVPAPPPPAPAPVPVVVAPPALIPPPAPASAPAPAPAPGSAPAPAAAVAPRGQTALSPALAHAGDDESQPSELSFSAARAGGAAAVLGALLLLWPARSPRAPRPARVLENDRPAPRHRRRRRP